MPIQQWHAHLERLEKEQWTDITNTSWFQGIMIFTLILGITLIITLAIRKIMPHLPMINCTRSNQPRPVADEPLEGGFELNNRQEQQHTTRC
jgi:hypothetical protein